MAHSYTPGLRVAPEALIRRRRLLPIPGEVVVVEGEHVTATTEVARAALPGKVYPVNVVNQLSIVPDEILSFMRKREGEAVHKGEAIAENKPLLKWFQVQVPSPITGTIESISHITGQVFLREPPTLIRLSAYIDGTIVEVTPQQGVIVEARCAFIQGIFGVGGETEGTLTVAVQRPEEELTVEHLKPEYQGHIVVGGSLVQKEAFLRARELGVRAVVVGGVHDRDLKEVLGYDLGVAITGTECLGCTLIITEGFGTIPMATRTFTLLSSHVGEQASCSGATQIRAGVIRPEVIIPFSSLHARQSSVLSPQSLRGGIKTGDVVRIIREPYFGRLARVKDLPSELQQIPTGSEARVLVATLADGQDVVIPRANVEMIEN